LLPWPFGRSLEYCAMREDQIDQAERQAVLENDRKVLEAQRGSTLHQHGLAQANELSGGRFAATGAPRVIGSTAGVAAQYPAASSAHQTELPKEPSLGYSVDDMPGLENPTGVSSSVTTPIGPGPAEAPSTTTTSLSLGVEHAAGPSSSQDQDNG